MHHKDTKFSFYSLRAFVVQALKILNLFVINEAISSVVNVDADSGVG